MKNQVTYSLIALLTVLAPLPRLSAETAPCCCAPAEEAAACCCCEPVLPTSPSETPSVSEGNSCPCGQADTIPNGSATPILATTGSGKNRQFDARHVEAIWPVDLFSKSFSAPLPSRLARPPPSPDRLVLFCTFLI